MEVIAEGLEFPEGPIALRDGNVILVEVRRGTLSRVAQDGTVTTLADLGGGPNGAALGSDGQVYVCNNGGFHWDDFGGVKIPRDFPPNYVSGTIQVVNLETGEFKTLYDSCDDIPLRGPNDLVFDGQGGFYFTDHGKSTERATDHGRIFYAREDGSFISCLLDRLHGPNGIGLSPDGKTLYFAETHTARVWAADIVAPGKLGPGPAPWLPARHVANLPGYQLLDSLKVEANGRICIGTLINGGITIVTAEGDMEHVPFPELDITNLCFGGNDMQDVWATASTSGKLYKTRWPRPGLRLHHQQMSE